MNYGVSCLIHRTACIWVAELLSMLTGIFRSRYFQWQRRFSSVFRDLSRFLGTERCRHRLTSIIPIGQTVPEVQSVDGASPATVQNMRANPRGVDVLVLEAPEPF